MLSRLMTRREQLVIFSIAVAIVIGSIALYVHDRQTAEESPLSEPVELLAAPETAETLDAPAPVDLAASEGVDATPDSRIDINTAGALQLESLPGIGPKLADAIIRYRDFRPFASIEDLTEVEGIGPKRLDALRDLIVVGQE